MRPEPCRCGAYPHVWKWRNKYVCGCITPNCYFPPVVSCESKENAVEKWNEFIKSVNEHFAEKGESDGRTSEET